MQIIEANFIIRSDWGLFFLILRNKKNFLILRKECLLHGTELLQLATITSHIMAKYENFSCLSKASPHHRSRWPGLSCKYICNDKLNPIICQVWALRSSHTPVLALVWQRLKIIPAPLARVALKALLKMPVFSNLLKNIRVFSIFFPFSPLFFSSQELLPAGCFEFAAFPALLHFSKCSWHSAVISFSIQ